MINSTNRRTIHLLRQALHQVAARRRRHRVLSLLLHLLPTRCTRAATRWLLSLLQQRRHIQEGKAQTKMKENGNPANNITESSNSRKNTSRALGRCNEGRETACRLAEMTSRCKGVDSRTCTHTPERARYCATLCIVLCKQQQRRRWWRQRRRRQPTCVCVVGAGSGSDSRAAAAVV